jgi:hypothetical protein
MIDNVGIVLCNDVGVGVSVAAGIEVEARGGGVCGIGVVAGATAGEGEGVGVGVDLHLPSFCIHPKIYSFYSVFLHCILCVFLLVACNVSDDRGGVSGAL